MIAHDIQLVNDPTTGIDDLLIVNGDFVIHKSDNQHKKDIINSYLGWWKQYPSVGVGSFLYLNSSGMMQQFERNVKIQLAADNYNVGNVQAKSLPNGKLEITENSERNG